MTTNRTGISESRPSRWWYAVAVAVVLGGFVAMGAFMLPRLQHTADNLTRFVAPGAIDMTLREPGTYTIFHEESSVVDGRLYVSDTISGLGLALRATDTGDDVPVRPATMRETYSFGSHSGRSVFTFDIAQPGPYRLTAAYDDGRAEPKVVLAVGHNFLGGLMLTILGAVAIVFAAIALAIVIAVVVWQRRSASPS